MLPTAFLVPVAASAVQPDGTGDVPDLHAAVAAAVAGDSVLLGPGTFTGSGNQALFVLAKDLTFESMSGPDDTIIDCEQLDRWMFVAQCSVVVSGITVRNGSSRTAGGAISAQNGMLTLRNSHFDRNSGGATRSTTAVAARSMSPAARWMSRSAGSS